MLNPRNLDFNFKKISGVSLIELMFALAISLFILSLCSSLYIATQNNFLLQSALSRIQENARIAIKLLNSELSISGYIGCARLTADFPIKNFGAYELTPNNIIKKEKDKIIIQHANTAHANLIQTMRGYAVFYATIKPEFSEGDILLISNCQSAEIFQVKQVYLYGGLQKITTTQPLNSQYEKNSEVSRLEINTYFVDKTDRISKQGVPINALYVRDINQHKTELVENIDSIDFHIEPDHHGVALILTTSSFPFIKKTWYSYVALRELI